MAPQKRKSAYISDDFVVDSDEDPSSSIPSSKRNKNASFTSNSTSKRDDEGNEYWEISKARRVTISDFKGKQLIAIREYYEKDGKWLPGKKGISMTIDQYNAFVEVMPGVEEALQRNGASNVARPHYDHSADQKDEDEENPPSGEDTGRPNHEATSDEDE